MSGGTDLIKLACIICETEWDAWGEWRNGRFVLADQRERQCPECMRVATAAALPEDLT